jgi:hypothetical protein
MDDRPRRTQVCPRCGEIQRPDWSRCWACGTPLTGIAHPRRPARFGPIWWDWKWFALLVLLAVGLLIGEAAWVYLPISVPLAVVAVACTVVLAGAAFWIARRPRIDKGEGAPWRSIPRLLLLLALSGLVLVAGGAALVVAFGIVCGSLNG